MNEVNKQLLDALMIALCYVQDIQTMETAGIDTGYKKGVVKKDLQIIKNAINDAEGGKVV